MSLRLSRPLLLAAAVLFAVSQLLYTGLWMYSVQPGSQPEVQLGFDNEYQPAEHAELILSVYKNSPAEKAGLLAGDRIVAIDGRRITDKNSQARSWLQHRPGDLIHLTVQRPGAAAPVILTGRFRRRADMWGSVNRQLSMWSMVPWLIVGLAVLFLRLEERNAWLLA